MKTLKKSTGIINLAIFLVFTMLGAASGYLTGNYRSGLMFGMAIGLTGITAFLYLRQRQLRPAPVPQVKRSRFQ